MMAYREEERVVNQGYLLVATGYKVCIEYKVCTYLRKCAVAV